MFLNRAFIPLKKTLTTFKDQGKIELDHAEV